MSELLLALLIAASSVVQGSATWYGTGPGAGHAAAGAELRTGDWRGRQVSVCHGERCVRVQLSDWCLCKGNRVVDLSDEDFQRLAPLSRGVIPVTVTTSRPAPTAPPTDVE